jgi:23S rRNA (uracil1939-C5)-methyltransferase
MTELTLRVEKLVWRGRGLAREESGRVVLLDPGVLPGELVHARIHKEQRDVAQAAAVEIIEPSPRRRQHPCVRAAECAGCLFGVVPNRDQIEIKLAILRESLGRGLPKPFRHNLPSIDLLTDQHVWRYRSRTQVHVLAGKPHFMTLGGKGLVPLPDCLLLSRPLARSMERLCAGLPDGRFTLAASPEDGMAATERDTLRLAFPMERYGVRLRLPASAFFQANWRMNGRLVDLVTRLVPGQERIVDLFSGAGNFALPLSSLGHDLLAVEGHEPAVECGRNAAEEAGLSTVRFLTGDLRTPAPWNAIRRFAPTAVIADPPRSGSGPLSRRLLDLDSLTTILWVSCDVVNTCRDIGPLLQAGWRIDSMHLADMFPQTWHMEVVFTLKKA